MHGFKTAASVFVVSAAFAALSQAGELAKIYQADGWSSTPSWATTASLSADYASGRDRKMPHFGHPSGLIESTTGNPHGAGLLQQTVRAEAYRGRRVRLTGYVKAESLAGWAGTWIRVYSLDRLLASDVHGLPHDSSVCDWTPFEIVLDIPADAQTIAFGSELFGTGKCWISDIGFDTVNPSETQLTKKQSVLDLSTYLRSKQNLDFAELPRGKNTHEIPGWRGYDGPLASDTLINRTTLYNGKPTVRVDGYAGPILQLVRAEQYQGKRVRFQAHVMTYPGFPVTAMIAVPGGGSLAFRPMDMSGIVDGAAPEWRTVSVVADVPSWAEGLQFGLGLQDGGYAWVADTSFEVVDPETTPLSDGGSPVKFRAEDLKQLPLSPENLDFER